MPVSAKSNNFHRENQFLAQITANHFLFNVAADEVITVITLFMCFMGKHAEFTYFIHSLMYIEF